MAVLLFSASLHGQQITGRILGTVSDAQGAAVPNAEITVTNQETAVARKLSTGGDGLYNVPEVPAGTYVIEVSAPGFGRSEVKGVVVTVATDTRVDLKLQVGSLEQAVTVSEAAILVDTSSSALGAIVDEKKIGDLPLNGRNWTDLTLMQPGITQQPSNGRGTSSIPNTPGYSGDLYSSNGATLHSNLMTLDGANMLTLIGNNSASLLGTNLGLDGIAEYKVVTNTPSAEYGLLMGSQTTIVSKGGTNQFHGDMFEYLRNSSLDARAYFDAVDTHNVNGFGADKSLVYPGKRLPPFKRSNFGGAFGGPIRKEKAFFYVVYEGVRQGLGYTLTTQTLPAGCFVNGVVPAVIQNNGCVAGSATSPITVNSYVLPLANEFPVPNVTGVAAFNYSFPYVAPGSENYGQGRVDYTFSAADTAFVRYTVDLADQRVPTGTSGATGAGGAVVGYKGYELAPHSASHFATLGETHVFSPGLLGAFRFSYSRSYLNIDALQDPSLSATNRVLIAGLGRNGDVSPGSGVTPIGFFTFYHNWTIQDTLTPSYDIFWTKNKHAFKFGALINRYYSYVTDSTSASGTASFATLGNFFNGVYSSFASVIPGNDNNRQFVQSVFGFYAQDDYRLYSRLTLNLGLRYEFTTVPREKNPALAYTVRNGAVDQAGTQGNMFLNPSLHDFSPRIGFAWDVTGKGTTSVRGGGGIYYDVGSFGTLELNNAIAAPPVSAPTLVTNALNPPLVPFTVPLPLTGTTSPLNPRTVEYNLSQPSMAQYNLTIQQSLPWHMAISTSYVGAGGWHLYQLRELDPTKFVSLDSNGLFPVYGCSNTAQSAAVLAGANGACPSGSFTPTSCFFYVSTITTCPASTYTNNGPRTNSAWGQIFGLQASGVSHYNGLQVTLNKQVSQGLSFQFGYTMAQVLSNGVAVAGIESANNQYQLTNGAYGPGAQRIDRGPAGYDVRNNLRFNWIYRVPNIVHSQNIAGKFLNGWGVSSIVSVQSGYPFTPGLGSDRELQNNSNTVERANLAPSFNMNTVIKHDPAQWFDPTMFALQPAGTIGNAGVGMLRGPNFRNLDVSLTKDTKLGLLGEAGSVQFRAEFFNVLNHPNFANPTPTLWSSGTPGTAPAGQLLPAGTTCSVAPSSCPAGAAGTTVSPLAAFATAGLISGTVNNQRQIQFALKVSF